MDYVGHLLVAPPCQDDEFWEHSVIFIYENTATTVGVILNKKSDRTVSELAEYHNLSYPRSDKLNVGGPMNQSSIVMLHTDEWSCTNTMHVNNGIRVSSDNTMISRICNDDTPDRWKLFLGMCIWNKGQLNSEVNGNPPFSKKKAWLIAPATHDIIFEKHPQKMWNKALESAVQYATDSFFIID